MGHAEESARVTEAQVGSEGVEIDLSVHAGNVASRVGGAADRHALGRCAIEGNRVAASVDATADSESSEHNGNRVEVREQESVHELDFGIVVDAAELPVEAEHHEGGSTPDREEAGEIARNLDAPAHGAQPRAHGESVQRPGLSRECWKGQRGKRKESGDDSKLASL